MSGVEILSLGISIPPLVGSIVQSARILGRTFDQHQKRNLTNDEALSRFSLHLYEVGNLARFVGDNINSWDKESQVRFKKVLRALHDVLGEFRVAVNEIKLPDGLNWASLKFVVQGRGALAKFDQQISDWERRFHDAMRSMFLLHGGRLPVFGPYQPLTLESGKRVDVLLGMVQYSLSAPNISSTLRLPSSPIPPSCFDLENSPVQRTPEPLHNLYEVRRSRAFGSDSAALAEDTKTLAAFLSRADPCIVNILHCDGFFDRTLRYAVPPGYHSPRSLRTALIGRVNINLDDRILIMRRIASSIFFLHTAQLVHKRICAQNVVLLTRTIDCTVRGGAASIEPFLVGFDHSRKVGTVSDMSKGHELHERYFLPPDRQGDTARAYSLLDDIYSMGVLFLEIALWESLVEAPLPGQTGWRPGPGLLFDPRARPPATLEKHPLRERLCALAKKEAARSMGSIISGVILACLSCLSGDRTFGNPDDLQADDGVAIAGAFLKNIIVPLEKVAV